MMPRLTAGYLNFVAVAAAAVVVVVVVVEVNQTVVEYEYWQEAVQLNC